MLLFSDASKNPPKNMLDLRLLCDALVPSHHLRDHLGIIIILIIINLPIIFAIIINQLTVILIALSSSPSSGAYQKMKEINF